MFFFSSRRRHTRYWRDWSSDVCSSDLYRPRGKIAESHALPLSHLTAESRRGTTAPRPLVGLRVPAASLRLRAAPDLAVQLFQNRVAVLGALLVVAHHPELLDGEYAQATGDLLHGELVVARDGEPGGPQTLLSVGERDVEQLSVTTQHLLGHLLERLLLLLGLLLEGLLLLLGLLHPLLGRLLEGLLLLGLRGEVGTRGVQELHVSVHHLLDHLLGVLLLLLDLLCQRLQHTEPL